MAKDAVRASTSVAPTENRFVNYKLLKEQVKIMDIVEHYGWELRVYKDSFVGQCPFCGGEEDTKRFSVTPKKGDAGSFRCHACDTDKDPRKGNMIELVAMIENLTVAAAGVRIAEWFGIDDCWYVPKKRRKPRKVASSVDQGERVSKPKLSTSEEQSTKEQTHQMEPATEEDYLGVDDDFGNTNVIDDRENPVLPFMGLKDLNPSHFLIRDNTVLSSGLCERMEAGFCAGSRGMMAQRFAVPIHNQQGQLVAYCGVALEETKERLKFPPGDKYTMGLDLFNFHRVQQDDVFLTKGLLVVEDVMDALVLCEHGHTNVVASMGGYLTHRQLKLLSDMSFEIPAITVIWQTPDELSEFDELYKMVTSLAMFSWVHVTTADQPIRELDKQEIQAFNLL